jgi:hypothetical protein
MWARKFKKCVKCGTTETRHLARGLCSKCYNIDIERKHKNLQRKRGIAGNKLTKKYLIEQYFKQGKSLSDIAKKCSCSRQYVHKKAMEYNLPMRSLRSARRIALNQNKLVFERTDAEGHSHSIVLQKVKLNEKLFSSWSDEMAYVLGVIYTDGCLSFQKHSTKTTTRRLPTLSIAQKESKFLKKILVLMDCNAKIYFRERKKYGNTVAGALYYFKIDCTPIYHDLLRLGLNPKKSLTVEFPNIPQEYVRHFIRGCWDGDGSVYYEKRRPNDIRASFVSGSLKFIEGILAELEKTGLPKRKIYIRKGKTSSYYFKITGPQCIKLYHYLYDNVPSTQYLERKYKLFKQFCDRLETPRIRPLFNQSNTA